MLSYRTVAASALISCCFVACGSSKAPLATPEEVPAPLDAAAPATDSAAPATDAAIPSDPVRAPSIPPATPGPQSSPAPAAPTPPKRERFQLHNSCSKPVKLRIERVNDADLDTTLTNNTSREERGTDGDEVRLLDAQNKIIDKITIAPHMKVIDVASSCTKLEGKQ